MPASTLPYYIAALYDNVTWTGGVGLGATIHYSFTRHFYSDAVNMTPAEQAATLQAMQTWSQVANVNFIEDNTNARQVAFAHAELGQGVDGLTGSNYAGTRLTNAEVYLDDDETELARGQYGFLTLVHEIGHSLGLKHPGNYSGGETPPFLPSAEDNTDNTVMAYDPGPFAPYSNNPATPMIYDIAAIQYMYGANMATNASNTFYDLAHSTLARTIWDAGGNDTLSMAGASRDTVINLNEGIDQVSVIGNVSVWLAFGSHIENAAGGNASDVISGNALDNIIVGNAGSDEVYGRLGDDSIAGNTGNDLLNGGQGKDLLQGGQDNDTVNGNVGNDVIFGNLGNDILTGNEDDDYLHGGAGNDALYGGTGSDTLVGGVGNDTLTGGTGLDVFQFAPGSDQDRIEAFTHGQDLIYINPAFGFTTDEAVLAATTYDATGATITLGSTDTILIVGVTVLTIDDVAIA